MRGANSFIAAASCERRRQGPRFEKKKPQAQPPPLVTTPHTQKKQPPVLRADTLPAIFAGKVTPENSACYAYGRSFNPTTRALGRQLAAMEGTEAAYATASGMAAISSTLLSLCDAGHVIVSSHSVYGGTFALMKDFLPAKCGIKTVFVDLSDARAVEAAMEEHKPKVLYAETLANPTLAVADLPTLSAIAKKHGATFVVDNTFAPMAVTPVREKFFICFFRGRKKKNKSAAFFPSTPTHPPTPTHTHTTATTRKPKNANSRPASAPTSSSTP